MMVISPLQPKALLTSEFIFTKWRVLSIPTNPYQALTDICNTTNKETT